jgi:hypothetical protein
MRFSKWLESRMLETMNPELEGLKRQEQQLLMSMEMRKDPMGRVIGFNKAGYTDAANKLKEVRARIKELEGKTASSNDEVKPIPAWIQGRRAV